MQIDAEEQKMLDEHRLNRAIAEEQLLAGHIIVGIAAEWAQYSKKTGYGLTYSEFCEGFAFDDRVDQRYHQYRKFIYEGIKRMYAVVDDISTQIGSAIASKTKLPSGEKANG